MTYDLFDTLNNEGNMSSRFSINFEADASELIENLEEVFPRCSNKWVMKKAIIIVLIIHIYIALFFEVSQI